MDIKKAMENKCRKRLIIFLAVVLGLLLLVAVGRFLPQPQTSEEQSGYTDVAANRETLEAAITGALDEETAGNVMTISVREHDGEYRATVRVVAAGGLYFPDVIDQTAQVFFDKAEELGVTASEFTVTEYSDTKGSDVENLIDWHTDDGAAGVYMDNTGAEPLIKSNVTANDLRKLVGAIDFGNELDPFQGEWMTEERSRYHRLIVSDDTVNFVSYEDIEESTVVRDVLTFYFSKDDNDQLVVQNQHGQTRYFLALNESGQIVVSDPSADEEPAIYEKVSDNTEVPNVTPEPAIGMTEMEVMASTWGWPEKRNKTTTAGGESEQWVYEDGYIYFKDGVVTAIQER